MEEGQSVNQTLEDGLVATPLEETRIRDGVALEDALESRSEALWRLVGDLEPILKDGLSVHREYRVGLVKGVKRVVLGVRWYTWTECGQSSIFEHCLRDTRVVLVVRWYTWTERGQSVDRAWAERGQSTILKHCLRDTRVSRRDTDLREDI